MSMNGATLRKAIFTKKILTNIDPSLISKSIDKDPWQMTWPEFEATFILSAIKITCFGKMQNPRSLLKRTWEALIKDAVTRMIPGVPIESLEEVRFLYLKEVRIYSRKFKITLS